MVVSTVKRTAVVSEALEERVWEGIRKGPWGKDLDEVRDGGERISVGRLFLLRNPKCKDPEVRAKRERTVGYKEVGGSVLGAGCFLPVCSFSHNHLTKQGHPFYQHSLLTNVF